MNSKLKGALMGAALSFSASQGHAQDDNHHHDDANSKVSSAYDFQFTVGEGGRKRYIPVDCSLLDNGALTPEFIKQMGVWGHLDALDDRMENANDAQKIFAFKQHLKPHGISEDKINKVAAHCIEHDL